MRPLGKIAAALGVIGAIGISSVLPASADWYGHRHRYYNYYGGGGYYGGGYGGDPNGCPPGLQGGNCAPYKGPSGSGVPLARFPWQLAPFLDRPAAEAAGVVR
jgi:hypothetical protein